MNFWLAGIVPFGGATHYLAAASVPADGPSSQVAVRPIADLEALRESRRQAVQRTRRVIYNNDGMDAVFQTRAEDSIEGILRHWTAGLAGSHVDTIAYNTNIGGFGLFFHNTKVGEVFTSREGKWSNNLTGVLIEQGTDPLKVMVDFARKNGMEIFWSMRMNNSHDLKHPELLSRFKRENADLLMGTPERRPKRGPWSAVDFGQPKVRDFVFSVIEDVCRNYDIDGIQLDYLRFPVLFRSTADNRPTTSAEREALTEMMRRIRKMTEEVGLSRGRPFLLAVRVPDSVDYCRDVAGIDLERWMAEGLIDILCAGGDVQMRSWEESIALGRRFEVPVYPSFRDAGATFPEEFQPARDEPPGWRGATLAAWAAGASGIEVFNMMYKFMPDHPIYREIGDPRVLRTLDRVYVATRRAPSGVRSWSGIDGTHFKQPIITPSNPHQLSPHQPAEFVLWLGESDPKSVMTARVRLNLSGWARDDSLSLRMNGQPGAFSGFEGDWVEFNVTPASLVSGKNVITIEVKSRALSLHDLSLHVAAASK